MRYVSVLREIQNRINFQLQPQGLLEGLKLISAGEWRINGEQDLPHVVIADVELVEDAAGGRSAGKITIFLRVSRLKGGLYSHTDDEPSGLWDWVERLLDAVETKPSDGQSDQGYLIAHDQNGQIIPDASGAPIQLLPRQIAWSVKMGMVTDLSFTGQVDITFAPVLTRRADRRRTPIAPLGDAP